MEKNILRKSCMKYFENFTGYQVHELDTALIKLKNYSHTYGLTEKELEIITEIVFNKIKAASKIKVTISCLIPAGRVPDSVVRSVLQWVTMNKKKVGTMHLRVVLQWLILVAEYKVANLETFHLYYDMFYMLLCNYSLLVLTARLLYAITQPKHVNRWYTKQILSIHKRFNKPRSTCTLLYLYKMHNPAAVPENIPALSAHSVFRPFMSQMAMAFSKFVPDDKKDDSAAVRNDVNTHFALITETFEEPIIMDLIMSAQGRNIMNFIDSNNFERFSVQLYYKLQDSWYYTRELKYMQYASELVLQTQKYFPILGRFVIDILRVWDFVRAKDDVLYLLRFAGVGLTYMEIRDYVLIPCVGFLLSANAEDKCKLLDALTEMAENVDSENTRHQLHHGLQQLSRAALWLEKDRNVIVAHGVETINKKIALQRFVEV